MLTQVEAGAIFAMGGFDGTARLDLVEKYTVEANSWEKVIF